MDVLSYDDIRQGKGYLSPEFREQVLEAYKDVNGFFLNPAYTDYGGDIQDRVFCELIKRHQDIGMFESTGWNGCNGIIPADDQLLEDLTQYPFPMVKGIDTEELWSEIETELVTEATNSFLEDYPQYKNMRDKVEEFLRGCNIQPTQVDYCEDDLLKHLQACEGIIRRGA